MNDDNEPAEWGSDEFTLDSKWKYKNKETSDLLEVNQAHSEIDNAEKFFKVNVCIYYLLIWTMKLLAMLMKW